MTGVANSWILDPFSGCANRDLEETIRRLLLAAVKDRKYNLPTIEPFKSLIHQQYQEVRATNALHTLRKPVEKDLEVRSSGRHPWDDLGTGVDGSCNLWSAEDRRHGGGCHIERKGKTYEGSGETLSILKRKHSGGSGNVYDNAPSEKFA